MKDKIKSENMRVEMGLGCSALSWPLSSLISNPWAQLGLCRPTRPIIQAVGGRKCRGVLPSLLLSRQAQGASQGAARVCVLQCPMGSLTPEAIDLPTVAGS